LDIGKSVVNGIVGSAVTQLAVNGRVDTVQLATDVFGNVLSNSLAWENSTLNPSGKNYQNEIDKMYQGALGDALPRDSVSGEMGLVSARNSDPLEDFIQQTQIKQTGRDNYLRNLLADASSIDGARRVVSDAGNEYGDTLFGPPVESNPVSDAFLSALTHAIQNPQPASPWVTLDDFGNPIGPLSNLYDLSDQASFKDYLNTINARSENGLSLDPQDIATSKALLFYYYGYSMGEQRGTADQLRGSLDDQSSPAYMRALKAFNQASDTEQQSRYDFYSNIQVVTDAATNITRGRYVDVTRDDRTIRVNWDRTFSNTAEALGVSADEALRKTDFDVYQAAVNAAFATDSVRSFNINGAWRPHPVDYATITGKQSPLPNTRSQHISSRALDINMINDIVVNNGGYISHIPSLPEPDILKKFTDNLLQQNGVRQIFQSWRMWGNVADSFIKNSDVIRNNKGEIIMRNENAILHKNHLHFGF
jgi:hypothetical protein